MIIESDAWLLHKKAQGNTSLRLVLFTKEQGVITCSYTGAYKKNTSLQVFLPLWVAINSSFKGRYIHKIETIGPGLFFKSLNLYSTLYLNELLYLVLKEGEAFPHLYQTYEETLIALSRMKEPLGIEVLLRRFELIFLKECGYLLPFYTEVEFNKAVIPTKFYLFDAEKGFTEAEKGLLGENILAIAHNDFSQLNTLKTAKIIMRKAINYLLEGKQLTSRQFFSKQ